MKKILVLLVGVIFATVCSAEESSINISQYNQTDEFRRWELSYNGLFLVLLDENSPKPYSEQLLAFEPFGKLKWSVNPATDQDHDYIVNIWIKNDSLYANSFAGYQLKIDPLNGNVIESKFTK